MTGDERDRPDLQQAARLVDASRQRAEQDSQTSKERVRHTLSLAERLRRLREANGFERIMDDAFGGRRD